MSSCVTQIKCAASIGTSRKPSAAAWGTGRLPHRSEAWTTSSLTSARWVCTPQPFRRQGVRTGLEELVGLAEQRAYPVPEVEELRIPGHPGQVMLLVENLLHRHGRGLGGTP